MPELDLFGLLSGEPGSLESKLQDTRQRVYGVTLGVVTDSDDPQMIGRVKVSFPWISDLVESAWARIASPWAGTQRGAYFVPEIDDEVLVAFRHGDLGHPYVIGALWSDTARPPETTPRLERRGLRSKSGHELTFDDMTGRGRVALRSSSGQEVVLDDGGGSTKARIANAAGTLSIELDSVQGTVTITAATGGISLVAPSGKVSIQAASFEVASTGPVQIQSGATVSVSGALVKLN